MAQAFIDGWISRFGTPSSITTDRGAQFESSLWRQLTQLLGSKKIRTTTYHPSSNGLIERFHRQLKAGLKATLDSMHWVAALPMVRYKKPATSSTVHASDTRSRRVQHACHTRVNSCA